MDTTNPNTEPLLADDDRFATRTATYIFMKATENTYVYRQMYDGDLPKISDRIYLQKWMYGEKAPAYIQITIVAKKEGKASK
jgi:hypothetical protein